MLNLASYVVIFLATVVASVVNALAGGGTLITFPVLTAMGLPAVVANMTNTVALCPGYLGGTLSQRQDLRSQGRRLSWFVPLGAAGGLLGGLLLRVTAESLFRTLVPFLILLATLLLALQPMVRTWLLRRATDVGSASDVRPWGLLLVGLATVYGGYFGAGLGVIVLSVLGLAVSDNLTRLNALKQAISLSTNLAAAAFFVVSGKVVWPVVFVMFVASLVGGSIGGNVAGRIQAESLRRMVIGVGLLVAGIYFFH